MILGWFHTAAASPNTSFYRCLESVLTARMPLVETMLKLLAPRAQFTELGVDDVGKGHSMHPYHGSKTSPGAQTTNNRMAKEPLWVPAKLCCCAGSGTDSDYANWKNPVASPRVFALFVARHARSRLLASVVHHEHLPNVIVSPCNPPKRCAVSKASSRLLDSQAFLLLTSIFFSARDGFANAL